MKQVAAAEFESEVLRSKEPVLVDFFTESCPPCRMMAPVLQEIENEAQGKFKIVKVDAGTEMELAVEYGVRAVPAFFAFSNGKCIGQTVGAKSKAGMKKWFEDAVRTNT